MSFSPVQRWPLLFSLVLLCAAPVAQAQTALDRLERLERRVDRLYSGVAGAGVICGAICALWAQNTARNPWVWFLGGFIFSAFALFFMLYKNAGDLRRRPGLSRGGSPP